MLYIIAGIHHEFQHNLIKENESEQSKYLQFLRHIIQEKAVDAIYEEWPPGSIPPISATLKAVDDVFRESRKKIVYYQIDLSEKERLHTIEECRKSCEKRKSMYNHRKQEWVRKIKINHNNQSNALLMVGDSHSKNIFDCNNGTTFTLENSLLWKLTDANIDYEVVDSDFDPRA